MADKQELKEEELEKVNGGQIPQPTTVIGYYCPNLECGKFYYSLAGKENTHCDCGGKIVKNPNGKYFLKLGPDLLEFEKA